ncbi:MAG TPA: FGGY-family carbohydrate kinase [Patescibacteria group bacterium]|nr:FGGY-family carbohydrate kinase [Patescibacteria group bacterium]
MLLGIDLGTTNVKALVTDHQGRPLGYGACPVRLFRLADAGVEQDMEEIWQAAITAVRQATQSIKASEVESIGVSSQGGAMQLLDGNGNAVGRVISWLDQRGKRFDDKLTAELGREWFLRRTLHGGSWLTSGHILRLRQEQPELLDPPNRIGFVGDIIVSRLCGNAAQDGTSAALTLLYNPIKRTYDPDLLRRLEVQPSQLPPVTSPQVPAGGLLRTFSELTGLRSGIPVSTAVHDQYAAALGTCSMKAGEVMVGTGTAWVLLAVGDRPPIPVTNDTLVSHHLVSGLWGQILSMVNGGSAVTWAMELTVPAAKAGNGLDPLLESCPPGSDGVTFWPFIAPAGGSGLSQGTKGRFSGLQLSHGGKHLVRAVVEGLAYELNRHLGFLAKANHSANELGMGGGASASRVTPQLVADVSGLPLRCFTGTDASLLGAAMLASGLLEPHKNLDQVATAMMRPFKRVEPGPNAPFYQEQYQRYLASLPIADANRL